MPTHLSVEAMVVTPELAAEWLTKSLFSRQRPMRSGHAEYLSAEMKAGRFMGNTIRFAFWDHRRYLINGQHTLWGIVDSGESQRMTIESVRVSSEEELNHLYAVTDTGLKRTVVDSLRAFGISEKLGIDNARAINAMASALRFIQNGFIVPRGEYNQQELMAALLAWGTSMQKYLECLKGTPMVHKMLRRDVLAIALYTFQHCPDQDMVRNFWRYVATDDGLRLGDPRKTLRKWLDRPSETGKRSMSSTDTEYGARAVVLAWNHWYERGDQAQLNSLRVLNPRAPVVVRGTRAAKKSSSS